MANNQHIRNSRLSPTSTMASRPADRFIQRCGGLSDREMEARCSTLWIWSESVVPRSGPACRLAVQHSDGESYQLNFIDTPGHVDFSYEVSRHWRLVKALLVVDAAQGVEAQSVANCYTAIEQELEVHHAQQN